MCCVMGADCPNRTARSIKAFSLCFPIFGEGVAQPKSAISGPQEIALTMSSNLVKKFYQDVLEQLFEQSSTLWEEEGLEESAMTDLRQLWESKLLENGIDLSRDSGGQDHHDPAPPKASGRHSAKSKAANNAAGGSTGRKARTSPPQPTQPEPEQPVPPPQPSSVLNHHAQPAAHTYQPDQTQPPPPQPPQQHHMVRQQQNPGPLQNGAPHNNGPQNRPIQVAAAGSQHGSAAGANTSGGPTISLLPYTVPISGPLVHLSAGKVSDTSVLTSHSQQQQQRLLQHQQQLQQQQQQLPQQQQQQQAQNQSANIDIQQLLRLSNASNPMRIVNMAQNIPQQQQQQPSQNQRTSGAPPMSVEDRMRLMEHMNQVFRNQQQNVGAMGNNRVSVVNREIPQKFRQQIGIMPGSQQFSAAQYQNGKPGNMFSMGSNQFPFQQPIASSQSSVIHVADSSGNQSALLLPVMHSLNDSVNNVGNAAGRSGSSNIRKPGQTLPLQQLDGRDDDEDDDDIFQDLSDDDTTSSKATPRPVKKQKTGDRRDLSERLEEEDLDSEDDDDNDDNTASVVDIIDNVVVCQYEKIGRTRNKWKLQLKSGMCSLNGKEYVFHKATGDAEF